MTIEWFRDLIIIIFGVIAIGTSILFVVVAYALYRRVSQLIESLETASSAFQEVCSCVTEPLAQPLNLVTSLFQGVRQGIEAINKAIQGGGQQ